MSDQAEHWSRAALRYEQEFIDPYLPDVRNPLLQAIRKLPKTKKQTVIDLGCGIGPLLPFLSERFKHVIALDFAPGMLERARKRCENLSNVEFIEASFTQLQSLQRKADVAVAVNSLVLPELKDLLSTLNGISELLQPGGTFLGIVPAIDAVHYFTMLLVDRAMEIGMPEKAARKSAAHHAEHELYDFAFGEFRYRGLIQHFWQPFEVTHRLRAAGFRRVKLKRVDLSWQQFGAAKDLSQFSPPWDWFFQSRKPLRKRAAQSTHEEGK